MNALMEKSFTWAQIGAKALLIFLIFYLIARVVSRLVGNMAARSGEGRRDVIELGGKTAVGAILVVGVLMALGNADINVMPLLTSLGLTGFALGFAFKDVLSNLLAGAMILFYRPFKPGSHINVSNFEGVVTSIDLRYTVLKNSGKRFLIPNSTLLSNVITISDEEAAN